MEVTPQAVALIGYAVIVALTGPRIRALWAADDNHARQDHRFSRGAVAPLLAVDVLFIAAVAQWVLAAQLAAPFADLVRFVMLAAVAVATILAVNWATISIWGRPAFLIPPAARGAPASEVGRRHDRRGSSAQRFIMSGRQVVLAVLALILFTALVIAARLPTLVLGVVLAPALTLLLLMAPGSRHRQRRR